VEDHALTVRRGRCCGFAVELGRERIEGEPNDGGLGECVDRDGVLAEPADCYGVLFGRVAGFTGGLVERPLLEGVPEFLD
jgi:hypothetical protein